MFKILSQSKRSVDGQPVTLMGAETLSWKDKKGNSCFSHHTRHFKRVGDGLYHAIISPTLVHVYKLVGNVLEYVTGIAVRAETKRPAHNPKPHRQNIISAQRTFAPERAALGVAV